VSFHDAASGSSFDKKLMEYLIEIALVTLYAGVGIILIGLLFHHIFETTTRFPGHRNPPPPPPRRKNVCKEKSKAMISNHPFYSKFELIKETVFGKVYVHDNLEVYIYTDPQCHVKSVSVQNLEDNEYMVRRLLFKNEEELIFILDRIAEVRISYPRCISLPSIVETFGRSCKQSGTAEG
jgi:hypothetical protein